MKISDEMVDYIADLSRLTIEPDEKSAIADELGTIIGYVDKLNNLDTGDLAPMSHVSDLKNVFRKDEVRPSLDRELLLREAPQRDEESFVVPKTVE